MKVYVENLPKKCGDCPCCSGNQYCNYMWEHYTDTEKPHFDECNLKDYCKIPYDFNNNMKKYKEWLDNLPKNNDEQHKNCPLQSLTAYTKQVRKEIVQEIREEFKKHLFDWYEDEQNINKELYLDADWVWEILDQIQE